MSFPDNPDWLYDDEIDPATHYGNGTIADALDCWCGEQRQRGSDLCARHHFARDQWAATGTDNWTEREAA